MGESHDARGSDRPPRSETQRLELLGSLATGVAHDFNNLLSVITAVTPLLRDELGERSAELVDELDLVVEQGTLLAARVLAFSRGGGDAPEAIHLGTVVDDLLPLLRRIAGARVRLLAAIDEGPSWVDLPRAGVEQILLNLVVNARDAMDARGAIELRLTVGQTHAALEVADEGSGMDEATRARIFEPFFTTKGTGTGLGLCTVRDLLGLHGGTITVDSAPGAGATFRVELPLRRDATSLAAPPTRQSGTIRRDPGQGRRVLLVEDEELVRRATRRLLEAAAFEVIPVVDGVEALALIDAGATIDALVLDAATPRMDGRDVAAGLLARGRPLPLVVVSGEQAAADVARWGYPGAAFLAKPYRTEALLRALAEVIERGEEAAARARAR